MVKHELDDAARHQLAESDFDEYEAYRDRLMESGENAAAVYSILCGMIWDMTEGYEMADYGDDIY